MRIFHTTQTGNDMSTQQKIYILTDYKGFFESKYHDIPYRSGMDKELLQKYFNEKGYEVIFLKFSDINFRKMNLKNKYVLYTSSEDIGYHYKDYIEDIILGLHLQGAVLIPEYKFLRANNNKVFMEILRDLSGLDSIKNIKSHYWGVLEDLKNNINKINSKAVVKSAAGAAGYGVSLGRNRKEILNKCRKVSRTKQLFQELKDLGRSIKHKGYKKESKYRKKFIVQNFIEGLKNDWRVEIYGKRYYIFYRGVRKNDFRASGSYNFLFNDEVSIPEGILDFAESIFDELKLPNLSIDVGFDGKQFYLIEFQGVYFGKIGQSKLSFYFVKEEQSWVKKYEKLALEEVFADSIINYINSKFEGNK